MRELEKLSRQVLEDRGHVDRGTGTNTLSIVALSQETVDTANGKLKSGTDGTGLCLRLDNQSLSNNYCSWDSVNASNLL